MVANLRELLFAALSSKKCRTSQGSGIFFHKNSLLARIWGSTAQHLSPKKRYLISAVLLH